MTLLVVGLSHHTSSFEVLEQVSAIPAHTLRADVISSDSVAEVMVISTCNRVEIYAEVDRFHAGVDVIVAILAQRSEMPVDEMTSRVFVHFDGRAVQHLFEVAAGLDSMVVGEQQVLGQVRTSFAEAQEAGTAGRELHDLAQAALRVGKDVRSRTEIDRAGASVVSVGIEAALVELNRLGGIRSADLRVTVLGAGAMAGLAVAGVSEVDFGELTVVSRNADQGRRLAASRGATAVSFEDLSAGLVHCDLLICCTGASGIVVSAADVAKVLSDRPGRPIVVLDLALPHDSDPEIANLEGAVRLDLAYLSSRQGSQPDIDDVARARKLIDEELAIFAHERAARAVEPVVLQLRAQASAVVDAELERMRQRLAGIATEDWEQVERGLRRAVATLLHTPTIRVKQLAGDPDGERYAQALTSLFNLTVETPDTTALIGDSGSGWSDEAAPS